MPIDFDTTRRETLKRLANWFVTGVGLWTSNKVVEQVWTEVSPYSQNVIHSKVVETFGAPHDIKELFAELFLGTQEKVYLIPAQDNPNVVPNLQRLAVDPYEVFTHTTLGAARSFAGVLDIVEDRIKRVEQLVSLNGEGNLVTFGSPTSNLIARTALRYGEIGDGKKGSEVFPSDAIDFKVLYELNGEKILRSGSSHRFLKRIVNNQEHQIPNWGIRKPGGVILCPETQDGSLVQDYLVISSLPNIFKRNAFDAGHRIINFGGTHREGTEAIGNLIKNKSLLEDLKLRLSRLRGNQGEYPYWQALILVDCDPPNQTATPKKVLEVHEVEVNDTLLRQMVTANFRELKSYEAHHG